MKKSIWIGLSAVALALLMAVANTGPFPARLLNLEIGGGYGHSGISMDKDGNVDIDGDVRIDGTLSGAGSFLASTDIDTEAELEALVTDVTNFYTNNDGTMLTAAAIDTEAELETLVTDVSNFVTNNDLPLARTNIAVKTPIMFSAGNGNPTSTGGCTAKALNANDQPVLEFANGQQAVWDLPAMPSDFDGSIENIVIAYRQKGTTGSVTFKYGADPVAEGTDPVKPTLTSLGSETPGAADKTYYFNPSASGMLGGAGNANLEMVFWLQIDIAAGGNVELLGVKGEF